MVEQSASAAARVEPHSADSEHRTEGMLMGWLSIGAFLLPLVEEIPLFKRFGRIISPIVKGVFNAEFALGAGKGAEKQKIAVEASRDEIKLLTTAGEIAMPEDQAMDYVADVIKGVVALLNLIQIFRKGTK